MLNLTAELESLPHWQQLNAYERALACCQLLSGLGQPIPGWMQIRQWIGKGSANDIHRAKQDFLTSRQTALPAAFNTDALPPALTGSINDWWQQLRLAAAAEYQQQTLDWQARLDDAQHQLEQQQHARRMLEEEQQQLREQIAQLHDQISQQTEQLRSAQDAALHATAMQQGAQRCMDDMHQRQTQQLEQLAHTLMTDSTSSQARWQQHIDAACAQLDGAQHFATAQIEQARQDLAQREQQRDVQHQAEQARQLAQQQYIDALKMAIFAKLDRVDAARTGQPLIQPQTKRRINRPAVNLRNTPAIPVWYGEHEER